MIREGVYVKRLVVGFSLRVEFSIGYVFGNIEFMFAWVVIFRPNSSNVSENNCLILSAVLGRAFLSVAKASSRYRPMFAGRYLLESLLNI